MAEAIGQLIVSALTDPRTISVALILGLVIYALIAEWLVPRGHHKYVVGHLQQQLVEERERWERLVEFERKEKQEFKALAERNMEIALRALRAGERAASSERK